MHSPRVMLLAWVEAARGTLREAEDLPESRPETSRPESASRANATSSADAALRTAMESGELKAIMESQTVLPSELFGAMLAKIYKRQK